MHYAEAKEIIEAAGLEYRNVSLRNIVTWICVGRMIPSDQIGGMEFSEHFRIPVSDGNVDEAKLEYAIKHTK